MIRHDKIALSLTAIAGMISIYLGLFQSQMGIVWFPALLLILGLQLNTYVNRKYDYDDDIDQREGGRIIYATMMAVVAISVTSLVMNIPFYKRTADIIGLSLFDAKLYAGLMAVAEEQFFRGFLTNFAYRYGLKNTATASVASALIGTVYHFMRYGEDPSALMFVFLGFVILSFISLREQRLSPAILAHLIHNVVYA